MKKTVMLALSVILLLLVYVSLADSYIVNLDVDFEENMMFSTYDVDVYLDSQKVGTYKHGKDFQVSMPSESGEHEIWFYEQNNKNKAGVIPIDVNSDMTVKCHIQCKSDKVKVTNVKTDRAPSVSAGSADTETQIVSASGEQAILTLKILFDENMMFSTYDVEMYIDDTRIATLPHGKGYNGTVDIKTGGHQIRFCKVGDKSVQGSYDFSMEGEAILSCGIHAYSDEVRVYKHELITDTASYDDTAFIKATLESEYSLTYFGEVRNDSTGRWRFAEYADHRSQEVIAADYYKVYFGSKDEIHALINMTTKKTARITVLYDTILDVTILEYVSGEEHDAKELFGGKKLSEYWVHMDTGEIEKID